MYLFYVQWNPDFSDLLGKSKLVRIIEGSEKSGVKLQCLTGEGKSVLVRIIGSFKKPRIREIGILLYMSHLILYFHCYYSYLIVTFLLLVRCPLLAGGFLPARQF